MEKIGNSIIENNEKIPEHFEVIIVSPGYAESKYKSGPLFGGDKGLEKSGHRSELYWDTRFRLMAAGAMYESKKTDKIIVGGKKINVMENSFAELMKKELEERKIPTESIETEEYTFDTASQIDWIKQNIERYKGNVGFLTDPAQALHVKELLKGFGLEKRVYVLSLEDVIKEMADDENHFEHYLAFFKKLHKSPFWAQWSAREKLLELIVKYFDSKGEKTRNLATFFRKPK